MLMKSVILPFLILLALVPSANLGVPPRSERNLADPFNFRYHILRRFNYARRVIASGDLGVFFRTIELTGQKLPDVGPASNMYRLEWDRHLEMIAYLNTEKNSSTLINQKGENGSMAFNTDGMVGFYWVGDLVEIILAVLKKFFPTIETLLAKFMPVIELILLVLWLGFYYPTSAYPPEKHGDHGATEILMADRYQVGCYSRILFSMCYLRPVEYHKGLMFSKGASCYHCPPGSQCEFFREPDGSYKEGNLCVINETLTKQLKEEALRQAEAVNGTTPDSLGLHADYLVPMLLVLVLYLFVYRR